jgi:tRNA A37 threonylcarbamoyladenosine dehydratase
VVGGGGVGGFVILELALLGIGRITVIEPEELDETNKNRYPTARHHDPVPGSLKVDLAERLIIGFDPTIHVQKVPHSLISVDGFKGVIAGNAVFGCLDSEGARLVLNELCAAYEKPYIDVATDIIPGQPERGLSN